jgi:hypothetical protein
VQNETEDERMTELLMQRATGALSAPEADALAQALSRLPAGEVARWERAAAELTAAFTAMDATAQEPMPAMLAARVIGTGEAMVRGAQDRARPTPVASAATVVPIQRAPWLGFAGWFAAAAALLLWFAPPKPTAEPDAPTAPVNTVAMVRAELLASDSAVQRLAWTATTDSAAVGASGDVVWSGRAQRGVMRIAGLQANDRRRWQYQLWIFDKTRDQKYPVDGGVFDIPAGQREVLVPIDARVPVGDAVMFAVTVEPAGGVVVSSRERIALLAQQGS